MKNLHRYFQAAKSGGWPLRKLNFILSIGIPFNRPHGIKIVKISDEEVITTIPYKRRNFNHIRGIHACGLATAAEFASGLLLLNKLDPASFRIIMQSLNMEYHYQAKSNVRAVFKLSEEQFNSSISEALKQEEVIYTKCVIELYDEVNNHVATGTTNWQIKPWNKVRTKL